MGGEHGTEPSDLHLNQYGSPSLVDGHYRLTITAANVLVGGGPAIDGDADGNPGGDFVSLDKVMYRLFGEVDDNRTVNTADFNAFRMAFGGQNPAFDFNGNNTIDTVDFKAFMLRFGSSA